MTFMLLRAGLPNSIVAAALAAIPIIAVALSPAQPTRHPSVQIIQTIVATDSQPGTRPDHAVAD